MYRLIIVFCRTWFKALGKNSKEVDKVQQFVVVFQKCSSDLKKIKTISKIFDVQF